MAANGCPNNYSNDCFMRYNYDFLNSISLLFSTFLSLLLTFPLVLDSQADMDTRILRPSYDPIIAEMGIILTSGICISFVCLTCLFMTCATGGEGYDHLSRTPGIITSRQ